MLGKLQETAPGDASRIATVIGVGRFLPGQRPETVTPENLSERLPGLLDEAEGRAPQLVQQAVEQKLIKP
jgi:hypothetical protein